MTNIPAITVTGASGHMGQMLIQAISANPATRLVGAIERKGHDWIGRDIGLCMAVRLWAAWSVTIRWKPLRSRKP